MPAPPPLAWVSASVPKTGHRDEENEDATAADPARMRFAVADGATEGWQSGRWAQHVATAYVRRPPTPADFPGWLGVVRKHWTPPATPGAAWYAEAKQEQGSFATLIGVEFRVSEQSPGLAWKAVAVGDSCLLVFRSGAVEVAFPLASADDFGNRPALVPSSAGVHCPEPEWLAGRAAPGDLFVLASDAVARYLLANPGSLWDEIGVSVDSTNPDPLIKSLFALNDLLNDDASVVAIRVPALPEPHR
jgi:hypothetical protein